MKIPASPPAIDLSELVADWPRYEAAGQVADSLGEYPHWDRLRRLPMPEGVTATDVWGALKLGRMSTRRQLPLLQVSGKPLWYSTPDTLLAALEDIGSRATGNIELPEPVATAGTRDRYIISSLMEEAITSSQLEGATTTRRVAKELLRSRRDPATRDERMILNNYRAMQWVRKHQNDEITPARVLRLHEIVTAGTLDDPEDAGRLQRPGDQRVGVWSPDDVEIHRPPAADELPQRLEQLCAFANDSAWMPRLMRAIVCHFMIGYDHYFVDGNGRTARALFYWMALREGAWMLEFTPISRILKDAPVQYARSYLFTETDDGDVTYFAIYQAQVIQRALTDLEHYLQAKAGEARKVRSLLPTLDLNHRQRQVIASLLRTPDASFTVIEHATTHNVTAPTARTDLRHLAQLELLAPGRKRGKTEVWVAGPAFERLRAS